MGTPKGRDHRTRRRTAPEGTGRAAGKERSVPYVKCPGCRLRLYSAAASALESCPSCGASLASAERLSARFKPARTVCRDYPCTPSSIAKARHALDAVRGDIGDGRHWVATLLVSELVTNSVRHSNARQGVITLAVCLTDSMVRVEVSDDGQGFETPEATGEEAESGRGLQLVRELCDRWGTAFALRACVWFELDLPGLRPEVAEAAGAPA